MPSVWVWVLGFGHANRILCSTLWVSCVVYAFLAFLPIYFAVFKVLKVLKPCEEGIPIYVSHDKPLKISKLNK